MSVSNKLGQVHDQMRFDRERLAEVKQEHAETMRQLEDYVRLCHWKAAADMATRLWNLEGWEKLLEARLEINEGWLAEVKPGQPSTDYEEVK